MGRELRAQGLGVLGEVAAPSAPQGHGHPEEKDISKYKEYRGTSQPEFPFKFSLYRLDPCLSQAAGGVLLLVVKSPVGLVPGEVPQVHLLIHPGLREVSVRYYQT